MAIFHFCMSKSTIFGEGAVIFWPDRKTKTSVFQVSVLTIAWAKVRSRSYGSLIFVFLFFYRRSRPLVVPTYNFGARTTILPQNLTSPESLGAVTFRADRKNTKCFKRLMREYQPFCCLWEKNKVKNPSDFFRFDVFFLSPFPPSPYRRTVFGRRTTRIPLESVCLQNLLVATAWVRRHLSARPKKHKYF